MMKKTLYGLLITAVCLGQVFTGCTTSKMQSSAFKSNQLTLAAAENQPVAAVEAEQKTVASKSFVENQMPVAPKAPIAIASTEKGAASVSVTSPSLATKAEVSKTSKKGVFSPLKKHAIKKERSAKSPLGDNQIVAIVLAVVSVVLIPIGLHRFYLGYTGIGVAQLLMTVVGAILSLFIIGIPILIASWIWQVIDLIRIIIGTLEPKDGSYS